MKKLTRKVMAMTVVLGLCSGVAVLQREKQVNDAKAMGAVFAYKLKCDTADKAMAGAVASTYVSTCVGIGATFCWGGPAGIAAAAVASL